MANITDHQARVEHALEWVFLLLQLIGGQIGLSVLVCTFLYMRRSKAREIDAIVINFCFTWILSSVFYSLTLYATRVQPAALSTSNLSDARLCLAQASLILGGQALTAISSLAFVVMIWLKCNIPRFFPDSRLRDSSAVKVLLIVIPYFAFLGFFLAAVIIGSRLALLYGPSGLLQVLANNLAVPTQLYCIIVQNGDVTSSIVGVINLRVWSCVFSIVVHGITLVIEVHLLWTLLRKDKTNFSVQTHLRSAAVRITIFSAYRFVSLGVSGALLKLNDKEVFVKGRPADMTLPIFSGEIIQSFAPLVAFLVLATNKNVLDVWLNRQRTSNTSIGYTGSGYSSRKSISNSAYRLTPLTKIDSSLEISSKDTMY